MWAGLPRQFVPTGCDVLADSRPHPRTCLAQPLLIARTMECAVQPTTLATIQLPAAATLLTETPNAAGIMLASGISFGKQLDTALGDTPTPAPSTANASTLPQASPQAAAAPSQQASTPAPAPQTQPMPTTTTSAQQADPPSPSGIVTAALPQPLAATTQDVASDVTGACTSTAVRRTTSRTSSTKASADGQPQTVSAQPNAVVTPVPTAAPEQTDPATAATGAPQASSHISGVATVMAKPEGTKALDAEGQAPSPSTPHSAPAPEAQAAPSAQPATLPSAELAVPAAVALPSQPAVPAASSVTAPAETPRSASPVTQITPALVQIGHAADGAQRLTVRLQPPELGLVQIRIDRCQYRSNFPQKCRLNFPHFVERSI